VLRLRAFRTLTGIAIVGRTAAATTTTAAVAVTIAETIPAMPVATLGIALVGAALAAVAGVLAGVFAALGSGSGRAWFVCLGRARLRCPVAIVARRGAIGRAAHRTVGALCGRRSLFHRGRRRRRRAFGGWHRRRRRTLGHRRRGGSGCGVGGFTAGFVRSTRLARTFLGKAAGFSFVVGHRVPRECEWGKEGW